MFQDVAIDRVRSFWDDRPCNIRHSPEPVGSRRYFEQVTERKYLVEPHIPRFAQFDRWRGKRVLEIGCGIGTDTMEFAQAGAEVTAVDLSRQSLDVARQRAEVFGVQDRVTFYEANAESLSDVVPPGAYDLIYSFGVIHHTPSPEAVIKQVREHFVGPGSELKVMVYHRWAYKVFAILLAQAAREGGGAFWRLDELVARSSEAQSGCPVTYTYSPRTGAALLEGFEVTDWFVDHIFPYSIPEYVRYEYKKAWPFRYLPPWLMRALERSLGWHLCLTARVA